MLTILNVLPIISLILVVILMVICFIIHILITKENVRWRDYKFSNVIVESFEMYDKGILSADKAKDIEHIKHEYNEQYEAYKNHKHLKDKLNELMIKCGIFSFLSILLSGLFYMLKCAIM